MSLPYQFRVAPYPFQLAEWEARRSQLAYALLWEQGLGKSKQFIDQACAAYAEGVIDGVIVVAPNGVHRNWVEEEIPTHSPDATMAKTRAMFYQSEKADSKWHKLAINELIAHKGLSWLTISYEAFTTLAGKRALIEFFDRRRVAYALDEAHRIKNPDAKVTISILKSAKYAVIKRTLTGTPVAQGPFDLYSQIMFLDDQFWATQGFSTFVEFRKHFGIFDKVWNPTAWDPKTKTRSGAEVDVLVSYRRLDELNKLIEPFSSRLTKEQSGLKLPPKNYSKEFFTMAPEQAAMYVQMRDESMVWINTGGAAEEEKTLGQTGFCFSCNGKREVDLEGYIYPCPECTDTVSAIPQEGTAIIASMAMVRLLRLQQITCGYIPTDDEEEPVYIIPGENRRLNRLFEIVEERIKRHKVIVWARFQLDITLILDEAKRRGIRAVRYDGLVDSDGRAEAKALFKGERPIVERGQIVGRYAIPREEQADLMVINQAAGATGLTLNIAKTSIYYSNNFKLIDRLQSEDRNHRIGQDEAVDYIDLAAEHTVDEKIITSLRNKFSIASQILGDKFREWL